MLYESFITYSFKLFFISVTIYKYGVTGLTQNVECCEVLDQQKLNKSDVQILRGPSDLSNCNLE